MAVETVWFVHRNGATIPSLRGATGRVRGGPVHGPPAAPTPRPHTSRVSSRPLPKMSALYAPCATIGATTVPVRS